MNYNDLHDVDMSEFAASTEGGQGLCTQALVTCVGIAVAVVYASDSLPGEERLDKFLAHLDEDDGEEAAESLVQQVEDAKRRGLWNLHVVACVLNPESLRERPEEPVDEETMRQQINFNEQYIALAARLTNGVRSSTFMVLRHHIYEPRNMVITRENEIRVDSYDSVPDRAARRSYRGFPDQVQLSSTTGLASR